MKKFFPLVIVSIVFILIFVGFYLSNKPIPDNATYVGSLSCQSCHTDEPLGWHASMHPKMMRKVTEAGAVVADLASEDLLFDANKAVWAIGSKWEQQFMGVEDGHETLLPGAWLVESKKWKTTGWDGWKVPNPIKRCHGCHTVGLNVETGQFIEPSVGCESCHGPGSWHVNTAGIGQIYSGLDPQVCGQCHSRGRSIDSEYFFPVGYKPGDNLSDYFNEEKPDALQNTSKWWANGHPRKRHQEYYAWRQEGHVNSLKSLTENYDGKYGEVTGKCLSCHAGEAIIDGQSEDYLLEDVQYGITCSTCHFSHGDLDKERITCADCHGESASYHNKSLNKNHVPCPVEAKVECQSCHMPLTVMNGGDYTLHSHKAGIIPPSDTRKLGVPNSCANGGCHQDKSLEWQEENFKKFYHKNSK